MTKELTSRNLWDDGVFAGLYIVPILSKLLSIHPPAIPYDPALARQESCRIGAMLYLADLRRRFGVNLPTDTYILKLKDVIIAQGGLGGTDLVLLWVLVVGGVLSFGHEEHGWFVETVAGLVVCQGYSMWEELMAVVCVVLWINGILEDECKFFRDEVSTELWTLHSYVFS
jgi:hypothetical protein